MLNQILEKPNIDFVRIPIEEKVCQWTENYYRWIKKGIMAENEFADNLLEAIKEIIENMKQEKSNAINQ